MAATQKYYMDLLSQFYQKAIRSHPQRQYLLQQKSKRLNSLMQTSRQKSILSSTRMTSVDDKQQNLSPQMIRSRDKSLQSDRSSNDSRISYRKLKIDEYFRCQFIYDSTSFVKSLMYSYLILTANISNMDLLIYLKQKFLQEYEDYFQSDELHKIGFYWNKIILISQKKQKFWEKSFMTSFKHFPLQFSNKLFEMTVKINSQNMYLSNITSDVIKKISQSLGYGINYYHVSRKFVRSEIKQGQSIKFCLNIVYVQQLQKFMIADRPLHKPSEDQSGLKIKTMLGQNISKLLNKYEQDNKNLGKLKYLFNQETSKEDEAKSRKQSAFQTQIRKNGKIIGIKV